MRLSISEVSKGQELPGLTATFRRSDLVRYAGASGDFNPIHWNEQVASEVGLPDVIAHGMLTMAVAGRVVTDWVGDPGAVTHYSVRFTRPVAVPNDAEGATVEFSGKVSAVDEEAGTAKVLLTAKFDGQAVLGGAMATVKLRRA